MSDAEINITLDNLEPIIEEQVKEKIERFFCDASIENCATLEMFPYEKEPISATPLIMIGVVFVWDVLAPIVWYFVRMSIRQKRTGLYTATNMVDIATVIMWIVNLVFFLFGFALWPFTFMKDERIDFLMAYSLVYIYADGMAALTVIYWLLYLFTAIFSGSGEEIECVEHDNGDDVCFYNNNYTSPLDGWLTWMFMTLILGAQYFIFFWFGADAVRYLRPAGGYDLYFLYPNSVYDLMVVFSAAPDAPRDLTGAAEVFAKKDKDAEDTEEDQEDQEGSSLIVEEEADF